MGQVFRLDELRRREQEMRGICFIMILSLSKVVKHDCVCGGLLQWSFHRSNNRAQAKACREHGT